MRITRHAPAKINLNLHVTGRRDDGYHLLDSLMVFTHWGDTITMTPAEELQFTAAGLALHEDLMSTDRHSPNLIIKAAYAMADACHRAPDIAIDLNKKIPIGAGLGGGSSNAAAVMHAMNDMWGHPLSMDELCAIGLQFGAEMPVCLLGKSARVQGVGDVMTPIHIDPLHLIIAWPDQGLLTADVFHAFKNEGHDFDPPISMTDNMMHNVMHSKNSLAKTAQKLCPDIAIILQELEKSEGCQIARMSGSGSACFGIFYDENAAANAVGKFKNAVYTSKVVSE